MSKNIRVTVLGFARKNNEILVLEAFDSVRDQQFYRFPGGGVEFGERMEDALYREFKEELDAELVDCQYLCTIEDIFTFEGVKKHEIIITYQITLPGEYYQVDEMELDENGVIGLAKWVDKELFLSGQKIIYPVEIKEYL